MTTTTPLHSTNLDMLHPRHRAAVMDKARRGVDLAHAWAADRAATMVGTTERAELERVVAALSGPNAATFWAELAERHAELDHPGLDRFDTTRPVIVELIQAELDTPAAADDPAAHDAVDGNGLPVWDF